MILMAYEIIYEIILVVLGYLFGSIPVAYLIGKISRGIDIRDFGSGNMGTANVMRTLGKKAGILTMVLDMAKGAIAVLLTRIYLWVVGDNYSGFTTNVPGAKFPQFLDAGFLLTLVSLMAVIGHSFPIWLKFKGGKSAAVGAGTILGINPLPFVFIMIIWFVLLKTTKLMSLSNLVVSFLSPPLYWIFAGNESWFFNGSLWALILSCIMVIFVFWRHKSNIKRLLTGTERKMGEKVEIPEDD